MQAQAQQLEELFARRKQQFAAVAECLEEVHATIEAEAPPEEGEAGEAPPPPPAAAATSKLTPSHGKEELEAVLLLSKDFAKARGCAGLVLTALETAAGL